MLKSVVIRRCFMVVSMVMSISNHAVAQDHNFVVETDWVQQALQQDTILLVDVRSESDYKISHIAGAVSMPISETYTMGGELDIVAPINRLQTLFSSTGLQKDVRIVLYSDGKDGFLEAARLFWLLEVFGFEEVSVMNALFSEWVSSSGAISSSATKVKSSHIVPNIKPNYFARLLSVRASLHKQEHILIDGRSLLQYRGRESKTRRYGHIPGAINIPAGMNMTDNNRHYLSLSGLKMLYADVDLNKIITVYCNTGKYAALSYLSLRRLSANVRVYEGSWAEWSAHPNLPVNLMP